MPLVSVIIPVYNGQKTIKFTIESVLQQILSDIEIIVINANSSDKTSNILNQIQDSRLKIFTYPKANVAVNRNRGLIHAKSEFVSFLDADDIWTPDKLEAQYNVLIENPAAGVAYSFTNAIDENGKFLRKCSHATWTGDVYAKLLLDDFIGSGSNVMVRSCAFTDVGNFDELLTNAQDTEMWLRLAAKYHFTVVKKAQVLYRISGNSMSSDILGLEKSNLAVIEKAFAHPKAASLQHLKLPATANLYKYLCYKALEAPPGQQNTIQAIRFLWKAIKCDRSLLLKPIVYKALLKLAAIAFLPVNLAKMLLARFPRISNTSTFLGYEKTY
jgi:glycosyltransferase involved in cell wall biosynthesis